MTWYHSCFDISSGLEEVEILTGKQTDIAVTDSAYKSLIEKIVRLPCVSYAIMVH